MFPDEQGNTVLDPRLLLVEFNSSILLHQAQVDGFIRGGCVCCSGNPHQPVRITCLETTLHFSAYFPRLPGYCSPSARSTQVYLRLATDLIYFSTPLRWHHPRVPCISSDNLAVCPAAPRARLGCPDWTLHVEGYGGAVHVPPDDHGSWENNGRGADVGVASRRRTASGDGGETSISATTLLFHT